MVDKQERQKWYKQSGAENERGERWRGENYEKYCDINFNSAKRGEKYVYNGNNQL